MTMTNMHACPGGCGANVPYHRLACPDCWVRLPVAHKGTVSQTYKNRGTDPTAHLAAVANAMKWYKDNPQ